MFVHGKKLLVLDVNGLLIDSYYEGVKRPDRKHDGKVNKFYVYKRPFCDEFIQFCLDNFVVGVWSSALEHNVRAFVNYVFQGAKGNLAFMWHQKQCTDTGFKHPENKYKPLFLKELWRLWTNYDRSLPWAEGDFNPSNTLLIDDSAYKAMNNPPHTAIFPKTYKATDLGDKYLGGELRTYLEGLRESANVQAYLQGHPIGEPSIVVGDPQFSEILSSVRIKNEKTYFVPRHLTGMSSPHDPDPTHPSDHWRRTEPFVPVHAARPPLGGPHVPWDVTELAPHRQGRQVGGILSREWGGAYPLGDGLPPGLRMDGKGLPGILPIPGQSPSDWRPTTGAPDHRWEHPDVGPQLPLHGDFGRTEWGCGIPESAFQERWRRGLAPNVSGPEPVGHTDWRQRRQSHWAGEDTGQIDKGILEPIHVRQPQDGANARDNRIGRDYQEADVGGRSDASHWGVELLENGAGPRWLQGHVPFENPHDLLTSKLPADRQKRPTKDRSQHFGAETVKESNEDKMLGSCGFENSFGAIHSSDWGYSKPGRKSGGHFNSGRPGGFSGANAGPHIPFQGRSGKNHPLETAHSTPPDWTQSCSNRPPSLANQLLDGSVSGALQPAEERMKSRSGYDDDQYFLSRFSPSCWSPSRFSPSRISDAYGKSDLRPPKTSQFNALDTRNLDVSDGLAHRRRDWPAGEAKPFASSIDHRLQLREEDAARAADGRFASASYSDSRVRRDAPLQKAAYDRTWEHPDRMSWGSADPFDKASVDHSGRPISISEIDDRPCFPIWPRSYDGVSRSGKVGSRKNSEPSLERRIGDRYDYEPVSRSGDRACSDYKANYRRIRDFEEIGTGLPLEQNDCFEVRPSDLYRRGNEDPYWGADGRWSEPRDSSQGVSAKTRRCSAGKAEDQDEYRESFFNDSRGHLIGDRDRFRAREYEEAEGRPHWMSERYDYRRRDGRDRAKVEGRDWYRFAERDYRGDRGRYDGSQRLNWSRKRDLEREQDYRR